MSLAGSQDDVCLVIQRHLNSRETAGNELADECLHAWTVKLVQDWTKVDRFVAVVQHSGSKETVLFIFIGSRLSPSSVGLCTSDLLALDDDFQCELAPLVPDGSLVILRIAAHRLTKPQSGDISTATPASAAAFTGRPSRGPTPSQHTGVSADGLGGDSDEPSEPVGVLYLSEPRGQGIIKTAVVSRAIRRHKRRLHNFLLGFDTLKEAVRFQEKVMHYTNLSRNQSSSVEIGTDALTSLSLSRAKPNWLDKYFSEIAGSRTAFQSHRSGGMKLKKGKHNRSSSLDMSMPAPELDIGRNTNNADCVSLSSAAAVDIDSTLSGSVPRTSSNKSLTNSSPSTSSLNQQASPVIFNGRQSVARSSAGHQEEKLTPITASRPVLMTNRPAPLNPTQSTILADCTILPKIPVSHSFQDLLSKETLEDAGVSHRNVKRSRGGNYMPDHEYRLRLSQADLVVRQKLLERVDTYSTLATMHVFVGTWNVNGRQDGHINMDDWLRPPEGHPPADIFVFGFQELDLSLGSVALNKTTPTALEVRWTNQLESALGGFLQPLATRSTHQLSAWSKLPNDAHSYRTHWAKHTGGGYVRLRRVRLAGMLLVVYLSERVCRQHLEPSEVASQIVATGILNMLGNKGGVGMRLTLCNTSLCFVNCHLAAGEANLERRNQDYHEIKRKMLFERRRDPIHLTDVEYVGIQDHDHCFIFGDLNYRICGLDSQLVKRLIDDKDYSHILDYDELRKQAVTRRAFADFTEGSIGFAPTYKFDMNSNTYDTSDKQRIPAYCDRILWAGKHCEVIAYRSHPGFVMSDHKPVSGYFKIAIRRVSETKFQHEFEAIVRSQDLVFNLRLPQAKLDRQELDFGPVHFHERCTQSVQLTNIGLDALEFRFVRDAVQFPSWLEVIPERMVVERGASVQIDLQIFVDSHSVASLNSGVTELSVIIVLRLMDGKDFFLPITGQFVPSSFGLPLSLLLSLGSAEPVASMPIGELRRRIRSARHGDWDEAEPSSVPNAGQHPFRVPKEILRLCQFMNQHLDEPELLRRTGQYGDVAIIRDLLDTTSEDIPFPETLSVHSVAFCLIMFLNTMTDAVIPFKFQANCLDSYSTFAGVTKAIACLPIDHQNLFFYIMAFLRRCLEYKDKNGTDITFLANYFGDVIFRGSLVRTDAMTTDGAPMTADAIRTSDQRSTPGLSIQERTAIFIRHFLVSDLSIHFSGLT